MKSILLTAGLGTRLRPITNLYAKPAVPFLNMPLLSFPIPLLEEAGVTQLVLNTHHHPKQIETVANALPGVKFPRIFSSETESPLGSGGGIWRARQHLDAPAGREEDFLVGNGDEVILPRQPHIMPEFVARHRASGALATLLVMRHPLVGTQFGGVWADDSGNVAGFGKTKMASLTGFHYIGLLLLKTRVFKYLPEGESNILYDALVRGIEAGEHVGAHIGDFTWYETGNPTDFLRGTHEALQLAHAGQGEDANWLRAMLKRFAPGHELTANQNLSLKSPTAIVESGAKTSGFLVLGDRSRLDSGSQVTNCVILPGVHLRSGTAKSEAIVID